MNMTQFISFNDTTKVFYYFTPLYIYRHTGTHCNLISHASELPNVRRSSQATFLGNFTYYWHSWQYNTTTASLPSADGAQLEFGLAKRRSRWPQKHPVSS